MDLKEFEHQVLAGEITDFEPYFENGSINYHLHYILAKNNIEVDRIIDMDGPGTILGFIKDKVQIVDVLYAHSWSDKLRNEFDFEKAYNNANNPLNQRLTRARPYLNIDEILLNEEPKCNKCLTPLIY